MGFKEQIAANESEEEVIIEEEIIIENADDIPAEGDDEEALDENGEPVVLEEWQKAEADIETDGDKPKPEKSLKAKKKLKGLLTERETELTEQQKENERLRLENEKLRAGSLTNSEQGQLKRPVEEDFEDEDGYVDKSKYHAAQDAYDDQRYEQRQAKKNASSEIKAINESISEGVDAHYTRAEELVEASGINPDVYKSADIKFKKAIEEVVPKNGMAVADLLISSLGEGSEKAIFFVGNNDAAREKFKALLSKDSSGFKAAMYLGEEKQRLKTNSPAKQVSKAKAPATKIKGDAPPSGVSSKIQKQYDKAHAEGNTGKAIKIKRQAKKDKIDTSRW